ncbi:unnamed protein product [Euphydryas editha]|uniref:Fatty acyl-CoA reductase n=1 Tax=Euphydryas editha TaxID=104508 RepID=A0AAU9UUS0_EUPED|nr:unnamed protein product [Euphydryas editha]
MGKVLIEKLLRSCMDLDRIYLLLRSKKGSKPEDRLAQIYSSHCFDRLRKERPGAFESKVYFISGDVSEVGLGLTDEDRTLIVNRTHIIFHAAASVRFDDPLKVAARLNLRGTKEVIELAKDVRNLESFIHVSTSYSNTNRDPIEEIMYPPHADWRDMLQVCEELDDHTLQVLTPKYLGELPNTYVFTKQLAEHVVYEYKGKLPIVIVRPSIVISSLIEPFPGWIDNFNGPVGISIACGKGILRTIYSSPDIVSDYIPVDVAIKSFIAASWIRGTKKLVQLQRNIYKANLAVRYFITQQWTFCNKNFVALRSKIKKVDKPDFYYDIENINKYEFVKQCSAGGKKYLLKEKEEDIPKVKAHYRRIMILDKLLQCIFYGCFLWWLMNTEFFNNTLNELGLL